MFWASPREESRGGPAGDKYAYGLQSRGAPIQGSIGRPVLPLNKGSGFKWRVMVK